MSTQIVVTRDWSEVRKVMAVAHETYCEAGYMQPRGSGMRMIAPYLNPGTVFVLGSIDGVPAAATSVVRDGPFGLPSDRAFVEEIDQLRTGGPLFEIGSLGILPWARRHSRDLITMAFGAILRLMREAGPDTRVLCSVDPPAVRYYVATFGFSSLCDQERPLYGAPAHLVGVGLEETETALRAPGGAHRGRILALADDPEPDPWLVDRRRGARWPPAELAALLQEAGVMDRLIAQVEAAAPAIEAVLSAGEETEDLPAGVVPPRRRSDGRTRRRRRATGSPRVERDSSDIGPNGSAGGEGSAT